MVTMSWLQELSPQPLRVQLLSFQDPHRLHVDMAECALRQHPAEIGPIRAKRKGAPTYVNTRLISRRCVCVCGCASAL